MRNLNQLLRDMRVTGIRWCPNCDWIGRQWFYWPHETWCPECCYPNVSETEPTQ
jgi:hypothetical protein